jgi:hypothetical protein
MLPEMVDPFHEPTRSIMTRNPNNETPHPTPAQNDSLHFLNRFVYTVFTLTKGYDVQSAAE